MRWGPNGECASRGILGAMEVAGASAETYQSDADPRWRIPYLAESEVRCNVKASLGGP
jgi:hypothetical protein